MDFEACRDAIIRVVDRSVSAATLPRVDVIDIDHDAGDYASDGGDYIKFLD